MNWARILNKNRGMKNTHLHPGGNLIPSEHLSLCSGLVLSCTGMNPFPCSMARRVATYVSVSVESLTPYQTEFCCKIFTCNENSLLELCPNFRFITNVFSGTRIILSIQVLLFDSYNCWKN